MSLKSSRPERQAPTNPKLGAAIARFHEEPCRERRAELLESLLAGPLLLAIHELPDAFDPAKSEEVRVRFVTAEEPGKGRVVCGFSSPRTLAAKAPAAVGLAVDPVSLLDWIVASGTEGLLLDPNGPSAFVSNDEARHVLDLPARPGTAHRSISLGEEPEKAVREALQRLLKDGGPGARATVREPRTGKSVVFERAENEELRMVLPAPPLAEDERARAKMLFDELAGGAEELPSPEEGRPEAPACADLQALFGGDLEPPARAAVKVFTWVFGFPPGFELKIEAG